MNTRKYLIKNSLVACLVGCCVSLASAGNPPFFTTDAVLNAKGELLMTQKGTRHLDIFSADGKSLLHSFPFDEIPTGLLPDGDKVYVTTFENTGRLQVLSLESGRVEAAIPTGSGACHPMFGPDKKHIYVCNQFDNSVVEVDPVMRKVVRSVKVLREPKSAVFSKDGKYMFVTNFLPAQRADVDVVAACVSVIEMDGFTKVKDIQLANGSNALRGMCITPDGKYIYVSHNLGRFTVPTSQLQQGWMNTSAFSVIDVAKQEFVGAVLVDEPDRGAAGIWSIACDDKHIFITHSGTHEVSLIDHPAMLAKFESYKDKSRLDYDLNFLYGLRERVPLQGNGPRNFIFSGDKLIIPTYFADILNTVDINTLEVTATDMNPGRTETPENKGEKYFNDANHCYQGWQSCNGCHPGDARTDGMNWDLMNDGVGNSKNCKSMLYSHVTPPSMISGVRESAEYAVRAGFKFIQFFEPEEEMAKCTGGPCAGSRIEEEQLSDEETKAMEENPDDALKHAEEPELVQGQEETDRMAAPDLAMLQNYANCWSALESMEDVLSSLDEFSDEILNEFSESMKELFDEMGLDELSDSVLSVEKDMDPADLKMMKIKHRNKEMKDIVRADAKYLKAVFDHLEKTRSEGTVVPDNSGAVTFGSSGQEAAPVINIVL